jgi:hypothetical protein
VIYFSVLFRMNDIGTSWNGASSQIGALTATDNTSFRCAIMARAAGTGYNIGVQKGGTGATATFGATEFHAGDIIFLVGKYDFTVSPNVASLWVNPSASTFGGVVEAASPLIATTGTDPGLGIDRFNFRQNTATSVPAVMQWDELRSGLAWSDVTLPPLPMPTNLRRLPSGAFQFDYLNGSARTYSVHASETLTNWSPVGSATEIAPGVFEFTDPAASSFLRRFYQLRSP